MCSKSSSQLNYISGLYVPTELNPADHGSPSVPAAHVTRTTWLSGPAFLSNPESSVSEDRESFDHVNPESDPEIYSTAAAFTTQVSESQLWPQSTLSLSQTGDVSKATAHLLPNASLTLQTAVTVSAGTYARKASLRWSLPMPSTS